MTAISEIFAAFLLAFSLIASPAYRPAEYSGTLVALGDSITYGYGLEDIDTRYSQLLADELGMEHVNLAVNGYKAEDLLKQLTEDERTIESVSGAEVVCLSIGGNELLGPFIQTIMSKLPAGTDVTAITMQDIIGLMQSVTADPTVMPQLKGAIDVRISIFAAQYPQIIERIYELNPEAVIVSQTLYNPVAGIMPMADALLGQMYYAFGDISDIILYTHGPIVVDTAAAFLGKASELTNISAFDIHPNLAGHKVIAGLMKDALTGRASRENVAEACIAVSVGAGIALLAEVS